MYIPVHRNLNLPHGQVCSRLCYDCLRIMDRSRAPILRSLAVSPTSLAVSDQSCPANPTSLPRCPLLPICTSSPLGCTLGMSDEVPKRPYLHHSQAAFPFSTVHRGTVWVCRIEQGRCREILFTWTAVVFDFSFNLEIASCGGLSFCPYHMYVSGFFPFFSHPM